MNFYPNIILSKGKEVSINRFHPWIFSGAIQKIDKNISEGDTVSILSNNNEFLAIGHYSKSSLSIRILSYENRIIDNEFWFEKIQNAYNYRLLSGLINSSTTNCYRLIFGEGDFLPGLIIDIYNKTAVIQCHTIGMLNSIDLIAKAILKIYGDDIQTIYNKSSSTIFKQTGIETNDGFLLGDQTETIIVENNLSFLVNWVEGQKTGFFLDQRDNRKILELFSANKTVLNCYSYSGGFTIYALKGKAKYAHSVDSSLKTENLIKENLKLNNFSIEQNNIYTEDVRNFLLNCSSYDIIILDPPAFAKHHKNISKAIIGYKKINYQAIKKLNKDGLLFTFSCSQAIDKKTFRNTIFSAAIDAGRQCRIIKELEHPLDHPQNIFQNEGNYLKGLILKFD